MTFHYRTKRPLPNFSDSLDPGSLAEAGITIRAAPDGVYLGVVIEEASPEAAAEKINRHLQRDPIDGEALTADDIRPAA
jgi:hypothetical protein